MSATITYKGSTLATVDNATKTLKTAGKYMEGDVIITDVSTSQGVVVTEETDEGGGIIKHITAIEISGTKEITTNGTYDVTSFANAYVNVPSGGTINNQNKTVTPTESQQSITADSGYTGLGTVTVNAISSTYVGSGITQRSSSDLTVSGATVTVPAGYYSAQASKAVSSMTLPTSASSTSSGTSKATIGRSTSAQYINIPTGYNSAAAYYTISATPNGAVTAPASISGTSATVSTGTNTLTLTKTVSVTPSVTTAGYISSGTAGNSSVSLTAAVNTPSVEDITIEYGVPYEEFNYAKITVPQGYYASDTISWREESWAGSPTISISSSGLITSTLSLAAGPYEAQTVSNTQQLTTKAAATITPTTTNQTIASGTYLTGTQTIAGDSNLVGSNILSGTSIFGVAGTVTFQTIYQGSSAPASSLGVNGDVYIQV